MLTVVNEHHTKGTHIFFSRMGVSESGKTRVWAVQSNEGAVLGSITWFGRWRKYVFHPPPNLKSTYEETCLREIAEFIETQTKAHRAQVIAPSKL
jgi:hypothetical protein